MCRVFVVADETVLDAQTIFTGHREKRNKESKRKTEKARRGKEARRQMDSETEKKSLCLVGVCVYAY